MANQNIENIIKEEIFLACLLGNGLDKIQAFQTLSIIFTDFYNYFIFFLEDYNTNSFILGSAQYLGLFLQAVLHTFIWFKQCRHKTNKIIINIYILPT